MLVVVSGNGWAFKHRWRICLAGRAGKFSYEEKGYRNMLAAKLKGMVTEDHRLELTLPASIPPGEVEIIILHAEQPEKPKVRARKSDPNVHPAAGLWADRTDLDNPSAFVSQLRHRLETRRDTRA